YIWTATVESILSNIARARTTLNERASQNRYGPLGCGNRPEEGAPDEEAVAVPGQVRARGVGRARRGAARGREGSRGGRGRGGHERADEPAHLPAERLRLLRAPPPPPRRARRRPRGPDRAAAGVAGLALVRCDRACR